MLATLITVIAALIAAGASIWNSLRLERMNQVAETTRWIRTEGKPQFAQYLHYAGAPFIAHLQARGCEAVIPQHQRATIKRAYDTWLYRERHLVECCINKLKHFRRIFSLFDKLDRLLGLSPFHLCAYLVAVNCQQNLGEEFVITSAPKKRSERGAVHW
jgi:hypothetical protein